jgi:hypothetical protein
MELRSLAAALVGAVIIGCSATASVTPPPTASLAMESTRASARPAPSSVATTAVQSIPYDFAYVEASPQNEASLWLVDLSGATAPISVVRWSGGSGSSAWSRDGQTVIVAGPSDRSVRALFLVKPLTGHATVLYEASSDTRVFYPRLSPDGRRYAFQLFGGAGAGAYYWGDVDTGAVHVLRNAPDTGSLLEWSADGLWLSYSSTEGDRDGLQHVFLLNVVDGRRVDAGRGNFAALRARQPQVASALVGGKGNQGAFGADVSTFDTSTERRTQLFSVDPRVTELAWSPNRDEFLLLQETVGCPFHATVWVSSTTGAQRRVGAIGNADRALWSADGATIYAHVPASGADTAVVDVATGRVVATIHGGGPIRACP